MDNLVLLENIECLFVVTENVALEAIGTATRGRNASKDIQEVYKLLGVIRDEVALLIKCNE